MKKFLTTLGILSLSLATGVPAITNISSIINISDQENEALDVNISAYDENNNQIMNLHYQTKLETLGELMSQESDTYLLRDFGKPLGLYLYGINYYDENGEKHTKLEDPNITFWAFWYINDSGEEEFSPVGISSYYLTHKTENIIWRYTDVWH